MIRTGKRAYIRIVFQIWLALALGTAALASQPQDSQGGNQQTYLPLVLQGAPYKESRGMLDPDFAGVGWATADFYGQDFGQAIAIQDDGKIVVVGYDNYAYDSSALALARYNPDGSLDLSFSGDGRVITEFGTSSDPGNAIALQPDGKILVAGKTGYESSKDFALARYNSDGSLDASFDGDGKLITDLGSSYDEAFALLLQPDNRILVAGISGSDIAVTRYLPDGTLDSTFSSDGIVITDFFASDDIARAMIIQPDGKIVVAGATRADDFSGFALARYNPDGSLDENFGTAGRVRLEIGIDNTIANAIILQTDGRIIAAGTTNVSVDLNLDFALARFNSDGSLDTSFGASGRVTTDFGGAEHGQGMLLQADDKLIVAGFSGSDVALARYHPDGRLDESFDLDGKVTADYDSSADFAYAAALQSDGKIIMAGFTWGAHDDFALARFDTTGSLDPSFGSAGWVITDFFCTDYGYGMVLQPDGKIIIAGATLFFTDDFALARFNADGSLDATFGSDGLATADFDRDDMAHSAALQPDGKIVVVGHSRTDFALARFNPDGSLDTGFGDNGKVITSFSSEYETARAVAIQADGKIILVGLAGDYIAVVRYNADGSLDTDFAVGGLATSVPGFGNAVVVQPDGKIVVAGGIGDMVVLRYLPDGSLDATFDGDGMVIMDISGNSESASAVTLHPDGRIIVAGGTFNGVETDFALLCLNPDGSLDTSFGVDGLVTSDHGSSESGRGMVLQPNGKIVIAGLITGADWYFALARYNPDGSLDTTFGMDGWVVTDFGEGRDFGQAVALQSDGKILVAGAISNETGFDLGIARYK